jgi:predicted regulator of Ras-like GTPase activity (Roadblock/LC7/MglB family)
MAIKGSLEDISLSSIIALCCSEKKQSCLRLMHRGKEAALFFKDGQIVHIALDSQEDEELIPELLTWKDGAFAIEQDVAPPQGTVATNWSGLFLEGMRHIDESAARRADSKGEDQGRQPILTLSSEVSEQIGKVLCHLLGAVGGRCVLMADRSGRLAHWQGRIDREQAISLAALIAGSFSATAEIANVLRNEGEAYQFRQSLQEGDDFNIFSVAVGERSILSLCFNSVVPLGLVRVHTLKVATKIQEILKEDAADEAGGQLVKDLRQGIGETFNDLFGE